MQKQIYSLVKVDGATAKKAGDLFGGTIKKPKNNT